MRRLSTFAWVVATLLVPAFGFGQTSPPPRSDSLVKAAVATAQMEQKVVLIEFGASWCIWCTHFQTFIHAPDIAPIVARNFVVLTLTVKEREDKKALENPGAEAAMDAWGGAKSGLPFYVFLDGRGQRVGNSNAMPDGGNIGFPATNDEIARFVDLMARVAPRFTASDRAAVLKYLEAEAKRGSPAP